MAKYDHGGGCPCGLQAECDCEHSWSPRKKIEHRIEELEKELKILKNILKKNPG